MINNLWGLMCFFINVIAFCEEKKKFKENLRAGNKYSDYIFLRDLRMKATASSSFGLLFI